MTNDDHKKQWDGREERRHSLRQNINRGTFRLVLERSLSEQHTARPLRKIGISR